MTYSGGKNGNGTFQTIINEIPRCDVYFELFAGSAAVYNNMAPAAISILCEKSREQYDVLKTSIRPGDIVLNCDTVRNISIFCAMGDLLQSFGKKVFMYLDPPYPISARASQKNIYEWEVTDSGHTNLLNDISRCSFPVAISTYENPIYTRILKDWRMISYQSTTRGGTATELLYMNYPKPEILQDYRYLGDNFREREAIKRKLTNAVSKLSTWPASHLFALLEQLQ